MAAGFSGVPEVVVVKGFLQGGLSVESVADWLAAWCSADCVCPSEPPGVSLLPPDQGSRSYMIMVTFDLSRAMGEARPYENEFKSHSSDYYHYDILYYTTMITTL